MSVLKNFGASLRQGVGTNSLPHASQAVVASPLSYLEREITRREHNDGKLALIMPTYRFDATARHCILTAAAMASDEISIYIADNSCKAEKWEFLDRIAVLYPKCNIFRHKTNIGSGGNIAFLMRAQQHEFLAMLSDDDLYTPDYFIAGFERLRADPECAAASGVLLFIAPNLTVSSARSIGAPTPLQRIEAFRGSNPFPYTVYRRSYVEKYLCYSNERPFRPSYMDLFLAYTLLCQGKFAVETTRRLFLYNTENWTDENSFDSDAKFYVTAGLPKQFTLLHKLFWAIDALHYFHSTYRPVCLDDTEASAIALNIHGRFLDAFRVEFEDNDALIVNLFKDAPESLAALMVLLKSSSPEVKRSLALFVEVMRAFSDELANKHHTFFANSLVPSMR